MDRHYNKKLESLRNSCKRVDLENVNRRRDLLDEFDASIEAWPGLLPINLRDFFRPEQIECLLSESIDYWAERQYYNLIERFVGFVARSGYRDEPRLDPLGDPMTFRSTPVHRLARQTNHNWGLVAYWLFKIFDRFDINYTDEDGSTHFHLACEYGCEDVVRKFLELGQDPNCLLPKTGDSPLHLALQNNNKEVLKLLLRNGAVPNSANGQGTIPLDIICSKDSEIEAAVFLQIFHDNSEAFRPTIDAPNERGDRQLEVALSRRRLILARALLRWGADPNAYNTYSGRTPLHEICQTDDSTVSRPCHLSLDLLLSHGADPNLFSRDHRGGTALHIICQRKRDEGLVETLLRINDEVGRWPVQLDALDVPHGRTPLQLAITNLLPDAVEALAARGAHLTNFVFPAGHFAQMPVPQQDIGRLYLASGLLACVELLAKKGYELAPSDALTIAKLLLRCGFLDRSANVQLLRWIVNSCEKLTKMSKKIMIKPDLSFHDLTKQPDLAWARELTTTDCYELMRRIDIQLRLREISLRHYVIFVDRLGQIMAKRFCSRWRTSLAQLEDDEFFNSCLEAASL